MPTSNVNLTPELEQFVKSQVSSGQFNNASEVHRAALAKMAQRIEERDAVLGYLRKEINVGLNDLEAGRVKHFDDHAALASHLDSVFDGLVKEVT
jgi:antitoxin ParD1/3/4